MSSAFQMYAQRLLTTLWSLKQILLIFLSDLVGCNRQQCQCNPWSLFYRDTWFLCAISFPDQRHLRLENCLNYSWIGIRWPHKLNWSASVMLMNKIGASCSPFNCVRFHWSVHTMTDVTKNTLETTLAVLFGIVKTAASSLAVKRKLAHGEPDER